MGATTTQLGLTILPHSGDCALRKQAFKHIVGPTTSAFKVRRPSGLHVCAPFLSCTVRVAQMPRSWAPVLGCPCSMMGRQVLAVVSIPSPCPGTMMGGLGVCLYRCLWLSRVVSLLYSNPIARATSLIPCAAYA